jgi:hypothetical protein
MSAEEMAQYTKMLQAYKPAQDKPVTEIVIFKLKGPQSPETMEQIESQLIANSGTGKGVLKQSWGFSLTDPHTVIWQLDWEKIQYHWDFWQTPAFGPVMAAIENIFVPGRPLVRHYEFKPAGMLQEAVQRVLVWNDEGKNRSQGEVEAAALVKSGKSVATAAKVANAVDMGETSWRCAVLGYATLQDAHQDELELQDGDESHIVEFKFSS